MKGTKSQANKSGWAGLGWAGWAAGWAGLASPVWAPGHNLQILAAARSTAALQTTLQTPPSTFVTSSLQPAATALMRARWAA